jgi:hypothetical protein
MKFTTDVFHARGSRNDPHVDQRRSGTPFVVTRMDGGIDRPSSVVDNDPELLE